MDLSQRSGPETVHAAEFYPIKLQTPSPSVRLGHFTKYADGT